MPDSYAHSHNGNKALKIADYTPRNYEAFILGCNGPDPLFNYQMYNPFRKYHLHKLGSVMHNEKTGLFLQNLFRLAQTNAQKDYCLGFLCHYSLDSVVHPYVNFITTAYNHPFNIENGHGYFESSLDSILSHMETGQWAANPLAYCPDIKKMYLEQIVKLFKEAVEATYTGVSYDYKEYMQVFKDFKTIKNLLYSPERILFPVARMAEIVMGMDKGFILCHMQPRIMEIKDIPVWRNNPMGFFCTSTIQELFERANNMSADYIDVGLKYFAGVYSIDDFLEDVGNKSYETGLAIQ